MCHARNLYTGLRKQTLLFSAQEYEVGFALYEKEESCTVNWKDDYDIIIALRRRSATMRIRAIYPFES